MSNPERWALVLTAAGLSCVPDGLAPSETGPFQTGMPTITSLAWDCSVEDAAWIFEVETEAWTGGGRLWMTKDGSRLEEHRIYSDEADADGAWDRLSLELDVATSWQEASSGSSTAWRCAEADSLSYLLVVLGPQGDTEADCRIWGADVTLFAAEESLPACEALLSEADAAD